jgi:hypothetical protein
LTQGRERGQQRNCKGKQAKCFLEHEFPRRRMPRPFYRHCAAGNGMRP